MDWRGYTSISFTR